MKKEIVKHAMLIDNSVKPSCQKDVLLVRVEDGSYEVNVAFRENDKVTNTFSRLHNGYMEAVVDYQNSIISYVELS